MLLRTPPPPSPLLQRPTTPVPNADARQRLFAMVTEHVTPEIVTTYINQFKNNIDSLCQIIALNFPIRTRWDSKSMHVYAVEDLQVGNLITHARGTIVSEEIRIQQKLSRDCITLKSLNMNEEVGNFCVREYGWQPVVNIRRAHVSTQHRYNRVPVRNSFRFNYSPLPHSFRDHTCTIVCKLMFFQFFYFTER